LSFASWASACANARLLDVDGGLKGRTFGQALQAVGKTCVEDATAFPAERAYFDDDRVSRQVTNRQHPDHVVGLISVPDTRLVQVDHATRNL
jgi:hypothetical protein